MELAPFVTLMIAVFIYFIPAATAHSRKHQNTTAIFALNLVLGWTILGWIVALVWAYMKQATPAQAESPDTHVKCPDCRELVLKDARKCKHCGCALIPQ